MSFKFSSLGHYLAVGLGDAYKGAKAVEAFIAKNNTPKNQAIVEGLSSLIPVVGPTVAEYERGVFAIAGQAAAILTKVTEAGEQKLLDAGFDRAIIEDFKQLIQNTPGLITGTVQALPAPSPAPSAPAAKAAA